MAILQPRASSRAARAAAEMPLPSEDTTPRRQWCSAANGFEDYQNLARIIHENDVFSLHILFLQ